MHIRRLTSLGVAIVFISSAQSPEAAGKEYAMGDCLVPAVVAVLLTWVLSS